MTRMFFYIEEQFKKDGTQMEYTKVYVFILCCQEMQAFHNQYACSDNTDYTTFNMFLHIIVCG